MYITFFVYGFLDKTALKPAKNTYLPGKTIRKYNMLRTWYRSYSTTQKIITVYHFLYRRCIYFQLNCLFSTKTIFWHNVVFLSPTKWIHLKRIVSSFTTNLIHLNGFVSSPTTKNIFPFILPSSSSTTKCTSMQSL